MPSVTVFKTQFKIGSTLVYGYTANEVDSVTGKFINYLSGAGLSASIELTDNTTRPKTLPQGLKDILGADFTTRCGSYNMESGGKSKVNLWDTTSAAQYYRYHDKQGNALAGDIVTALVSTTLDIILDDAFGRVYEDGAAIARTNARLAGKITRRTLTDAIKDYVETHSTSENYRQWIYSNCSDKINLALFGKKACQLKKERGCKDNDALRDTHSKAELVLIDRIEGHAVILIDKGMESLMATQDAIAFYG